MKRLGLSIAVVVAAIVICAKLDLSSCASYRRGHDPAAIKTALLIVAGVVTIAIIMALPGLD